MADSSATTPASAHVACGICRKEAKSSRLLPCLHAFCAHCIQSRAKIRPECPTCASPFAAQQATSLPTRLPTHCDDAHPQERLQFYCHECSKLVCRLCIMSAHRSHRASKPEDVYPHMLEQLRAALGRASSSSSSSSSSPSSSSSSSSHSALHILEEKLGLLDAFSSGEAGDRAATTTPIQEQMAASIKTSEAKLAATFSELSMILQRREQELTNELRNISSSRSRLLEAQKHNLQRSLHEVQAVRSFAAEVVAHPDPLHTVVLGGRIIRELERLSPSAWLLQPAAGARIAFEPTSRALLSAIRSTGEIVVSDCSPHTCSLVHPVWNVETMSQDHTLSNTLMLPTSALSPSSSSRHSLVSRISSPSPLHSPRASMLPLAPTFFAHPPPLPSSSPSLSASALQLTILAHTIHHAPCDTVSFQAFISRPGQAEERSLAVTHIGPGRYSVFLDMAAAATNQHGNVTHSVPSSAPSAVTSSGEDASARVRKSSSALLSPSSSFSTHVSSGGEWRISVLLHGEHIAGSPFVYLQDVPADDLKQELLRTSGFAFGTCKDTLLQGFTWLTYAQAAQVLINHPVTEMQAVGLWATGRYLGDKDTLLWPLPMHVDRASIGNQAATTVTANVTITATPTSPRPFSSTDFFLESIRVLPQLSVAYTSLAARLLKLPTLFRQVTLPDGRTMNARELLVEALRHDPNNTYALLNLGQCLPAMEIVTLPPDGRIMSKRHLLIEAIRTDVNSAQAYAALAATIAGTPEEHVTLHNGKVMDVQQLCLQALKLDPRNAAALVTLAGTLHGRGRDAVQLADGRRLTQQQLYIEAIRNDVQQASAYINLGWSLDPTEVATLADGRSLNKMQLYQEALSLCSNTSRSSSYAFNNMALAILPGEHVGLADGRTLTKRELLVEAIAADPFNVMAYNNLALLLPKSETVTLSDGRTMTKSQLLIEAIRRNPHVSKVYSNLALTLARCDDAVSLHDGRKLSKQQLYAEALRIDPRNNALAYQNLAAILPPEQTIDLEIGATSAEAVHGGGERTAAIAARDKGRKSNDTSSMTPMDLCVEAMRAACNTCTRSFTENASFALGQSLHQAILSGSIGEETPEMVAASVHHMQEKAVGFERIDAGTGASTAGSGHAAASLSANSAASCRHEYCRQTLCPECSFVSHRFALSSNMVSTEVVSQHVSHIQSTLEDTKGYDVVLLEAMEAADAQGQDLNECCGALGGKVLAMFGELFAALQQREQELKKLHRQHATKLQRSLEHLVSHLSARVRAFRFTTGFVQRIVQEGSMLEIVGLTGFLLERLKQFDGGDTWTAELEKLNSMGELLFLPTHRAVNASIVQATGRFIDGDCRADTCRVVSTRMVGSSGAAAGVGVGTGSGAGHFIVTILALNAAGNACGYQPFKAVLKGPQDKAEVPVQEIGMGFFTCSVNMLGARGHAQQDTALAVTLHDEHIVGSPVSLSIQLDVEALCQELLDIQRYHAQDRHKIIDPEGHIDGLSQLIASMQVKKRTGHGAGVLAADSRENAGGGSHEVDAAFAGATQNGHQQQLRKRGHPQVGLTYEAAALELIARGNPVQQSIGFWAAARCVSEGETLRLPQGQPLDKWQLLIESLRLDPNNMAAFLTLAASMKESDTVDISGGRRLNRRQLLIEALRRNPTCARAYNCLGMLLRGSETVALPNSPDMRNSTDGASQENGFTKSQLYIQAIFYDPGYSAAYNNLSCTLLRTNDFIDLANGRSLSKRDLLCEALRCDRTNARAYANLALLLNPSETIVLDLKGEARAEHFTATAGPTAEPPRSPHQERKWSAVELNLEALRHDPTLAMAYNNLGMLLNRSSPPSPSTMASKSVLLTLPDGRSLDQRQLFAEALRHDPVNFSAMSNLALLFAEGEFYATRDGRRLTKREMFLEALRINPAYAPALCNLAAMLRGNHTILLPDGRALDCRKLCIEAIRCDADYANAYNTLGLCLGQAETIVLPNLQVVDQRQLFLMALRLDSSSASGTAAALLNLARTLRAGELIELDLHRLGGDGGRKDTVSSPSTAGARPYTARNLVLLALSRDPTSAAGYVALAAMMLKDEAAVAPPDGRQLSRRDLLLEALAYDSNNAAAYTLLALDVEHNEKVVLPAPVHAPMTSPASPTPVGSTGKRSMTKRQLLLEALRCHPFNAQAYSALATCLRDAGEDEVILHDGRRLTRQQLLGEAARLQSPRSDPRTGRANRLSFAAPTNPLTSPVNLAPRRDSTATTTTSLSSSRRSSSSRPGSSFA